MAVFTDQVGRHIEINNPKRIISLVPSQTELLFDLGLDDRVAGVTKFCTHPTDKVKGKPIMGGTKQLDMDVIRSLRPDLIIGNKEENDRVQLEQLMADYPVLITDPVDLGSATGMVSLIGNITNTTLKAESINSAIGNGFEKLSLLVDEKPRRVVYLIWRKPYMAAGQKTFINDMLLRCGWENAIDFARYPVVDVQSLKKAEPDLVLLSTEPYPFKEKHLDEINGFLPDVPVALVDGEMFSWYGSRLIQSSEYFIRLINSLKC